MSGERGSAALLVVLLMPLFVLVLAGAIDLGSLRVAAHRARAAADLAVLVAVNDQDELVLQSDGRLQLSADAEAVARDYLARNLSSVGAQLADDARGLAQGADIRAFPDGGVDPLDGTRYDHPTVRLRVDVPLRTGALQSLLGAAISVRAHSAAAAR